MAHILLAEDEPVLARNIMRALEQAGTTVEIAPSAAATRKALAETPFDLVIADISLGDGNGLDVIGDASARLKDTPIIVMTGQDSVANRARAEQLPVAAFLSKPFALARLRELVSGLTSAKLSPGSAKREPSVVMYSHDTIGLGHMRRNSAIARELVAQVPGISILMLVGCPSGMIFEPCIGVDYVKLPSLAKLGRGVFQTGSLRIDATATRDMRAKIIEGVVRSLKPDIFLVDHEPVGAMDELRPLLAQLKGNPSTRTVLGLRDILDDPSVTRATWQAKGIDRLIADFYDHVLVYGDETYFPSIEAYGLNALRPGAVTQCGLVTTVQKATQPRRPKTPRHVVVSGGGGRDAFPMIKVTIEGLRLLPRARRPKLTVITGPLMDAELRDEAHRLGRVADITVLERVPDLPALLQVADLFITMTGYNSIFEGLAVGCPIVTVPRLGPSAEQRLRAETLERLGLARYLRREDLSPEKMADILTQNALFVSPDFLKTDGIQNAGRVLCNHIQDIRQIQMEQTHA